MINNFEIFKAIYSKHKANEKEEEKKEEKIDYIKFSIKKNKNLN